MSLFGALSTAVSGLYSQATAFGDISDNIANSQTTGFKRIDTTFTDYLTTSTAETNDSGSVAARPLYENTVQGSITQNDNPLSLAISGQGFFSVSKPLDNTVNGIENFDAQTFYTRAGDFQLDKNGYLVNSSGNYLNGWSVDATGNPIRNALTPIKVTETTDKPAPTTAVNLDANLPNTTTSTTPISSAVTVYDALGATHALSLSFSPVAGTPGQWSLAVTDDAGATIGTSTISFGADGTLSSVTNGGSTISTAGAAANVTLSTNYPAVPSGTQSISLNLGTIGGTTGLTQFAGTTYTLRGITQDGVPPGAFSRLSMTAAGDVIANFDNGQSRVIARVPIVTFPAPDALQRQDGSAFSGTAAAGDPLAHDAESSGAGSLVTKASEASNVDISQEFSKLIIAQRAYSANAKLITTADDMLQSTVDMKR